MNAQVADLRERDGRYVDDDGQVREERNGEEHRGEDSDGSGEPDLQIFKGAGELQLVEHRQEEARGDDGSEDRRDHTRGILTPVMENLRRYAQQADTRNVAKVRESPYIINYSSRKERIKVGEIERRRREVSHAGEMISGRGSQSPSISFNPLVQKGSEESLT